MRICQHDNCIHSSMLGLRNGFSYGFKIRFLHSIFYSLAFSPNEPLLIKIKFALTKGLEHGLALGYFCAFTKLIICFLQKMRNQQSSYHNLLAGIIGGALFFSKSTHVRS